MRFFGVCSAILLLLGLSSAVCQTPDDRYVRIHSLIEEADQLSASGDTRGAVKRYVEAQAAIKELQRLYPDWNERVVTYRLEYLAGKLGPLTAETSGKAKGTPSSIPTSNVSDPQQEIARLTAEKTLLEAKLREALRVQPAAADPRELAKAEERIKAVEKERDILAISLEQARRAAAVPAAGDPEKLSLKESVAALQASNRVMKSEQLEMEKRLVDLVKSVGSLSGEGQREREMELIEMRTALAAANRELGQMRERLAASVQPQSQVSEPVQAASPGGSTNELEALRARLAVFESKPVPYSAEELALFKQPPIQVALTQTNLPPSTAARKSGQLPAGAGPLLREAERAIDAGQFGEAEQKLRDILRQDDGHPFVLAKLAAVQMDQDKITDAEKSLTRALQTDPEDPASLYLLGSVRIRQEKYDDAVGLLSRAVKLVPDNAQAHYFLGKALIQQGQRAPAETELRKAIQLRPGWGDAHYLLAVIYSTQDPKYKDLGQYHYKKAIAGGAPRNPDLERWMEKHMAPPSR